MSGPSAEAVANAQNVWAQIVSDEPPEDLEGQEAA